ncbi:WD domain containing protein [Cordyceps fumosorosea ARSEF 2679]|uniref:WD domain containing protein n=1 Tax=Cordyceps fumosorosea (strain ARSEF 2679) TaxID=1081104 RepID=A0A167J1P6_CORFA|nr:WD domain containing protein [Cordyceps fumosorosea ARSEF 2679]OAA49696.1 WD domain containing protein [Cordyceps fumosorosea ARSEF 2679]
MAKNKTHRFKVDEPKKRKRDGNDSEITAKRARPQDANGVLAEPTSTKDLAKRLDRSDTAWKISKPMGGRMLDIDPILTDNGEYLILAYNTSIQVFSAVDSLLVRRIPVSTIDASAKQGSTPSPIVATRLSTQDASLVWVACANGRVYRINWTQESKTLESFQTASKTAHAMSIVPLAGKGRSKEIVIVAESDKPTHIELVAYESDLSSKPKPKPLVSLKRPGTALRLLESTKDGRFLVGAINDLLFLGVSKQSPTKADELQYEFYAFDTPDLITTLDLRAYKRTSKHARGDTEKVVDVLVGGARGGIYLYHDVIARCQATESGKPNENTIHAQKYHWHRKAVHSVKWSKDGNYMISGGSENTLVLWQMDTSKKDFLPHLSGSVENIVVSSDGASYVVHLDDNSTMILSTSELKPSAYVSGVQSAAANVQTPKDQLVKRVWEVQEHVRQRIPAAIRSNASSRLHVCVGAGRQSTMSGRFSAPLLQAFDLETFTSVSKQALARTNPTHINMTTTGHAIDEPLVTHVEFSGDGKWLASIDDWQPAARDIDNVSAELRDQFIRERREIYLKFWEVQEGDEPVALVSRINGPHATSSSEPVLDLAADPSSTCFATIGGDGIVRLWRPRTRQANGIVSKGANGKDAVSWGCAQIIPVGEGYGVGDLTDVASSSTPQGKISFSEDGSTIFAAFGFSELGSVYVIDAASGKVVRILEGLWEGNLHAVRALSQFVVVLSDSLYVYDIVSDELRYGIEVPQLPGMEDLQQLAVDHASGHFAVTLPIGDISSIGIFSPEDPEPLLVRSTPHRIVSLTTAPGTSGFLALDDAAQIWTVTEGSDPSSIVTAQPLQDIHLDGKVDDGAANGEAPAIADDDVVMASDDEEETTAANGVADDDMDIDLDDVPTSVISQQSLADIFNAAPAFAGSSVEDMFYKVTGLLGSKPLTS